MPKISTVTIACALCVGSTRELYLGAALDAIAGAVDALVVNDNSGLVRGENVATLETSAFASRGDLRIARHPFVDFADMRNRAFGELSQLPRAPDWVLFLDADEVHGAQLRYVAREILPRLGPETTSVDAYTYHFFGTYRWITDVARRFVFYRYANGLRWVNPIHEKIVGLRGRALVLPYVYHHYGNVVPPPLLARKHGRYFELGNPVPPPPAEDEATVAYFLENVRRVRPFLGRHPRAARALVAQLERAFESDFAAIDAGFRLRRTRALRAAGALRALNETLRVELRRLEHPFAYRAPTSAE
jgi:hypothetical protein